MIPADTRSLASTTEESEEQRRFRRFVRHRHLKPTFVFQPRDQEIIKLVSQHRVISSEEIQLSVRGSNQAILRRLQKLFHHGLLDRPKSQRHFGNVPFVYALGQRGAELMAKDTGRRPADWSEKNRQIQAPYLEHALMVSRFQSALEYACAASGNVVLERWCPDGTIRDAVWVQTEHGRERIPIAPDAFFIARVLDDGQIGRVHAFVECDRGTMTLARFLTKLRGFFQFWRSGRAEKRLGMKNFLVVTVTASQERAEHLREVCQQVSGRGLRMFLFACESDYLPITDRAVLGSIWKTPVDGVPHSLLE